MLEPMRLRRCGRLAVHSAKRNYDMVSQGNLKNRRLFWQAVTTHSNPYDLSDIAVFPLAMPGD